MSKAMAVLMTLAVAVSASAGVMYQGSLTSADGGLVGTGAWVNPGPTTLSWVVTQDDVLGYFHYSYTMDVPVGAVSHFIVEASPDFPEADLLNPQGPFGSIDIDTFLPGPGNEGMPDDIFGIKFDATSGTSITIEFDTYHRPMWGDFYSKDGQAGGQGLNAVWNFGFTNPDWDPPYLYDPDADPPVFPVPPSDGSYMYHVLVPDTVVPEPASMALVGIGLGALVLVRRKRV